MLSSLETSPELLEYPSRLSDAEIGKPVICDVTDPKTDFKWQIGITKIYDKELNAQVFSIERANPGNPTPPPYIYNCKIGSFENFDLISANGKVVVMTGTPVKLFQDGPLIVLPHDTQDRRTATDNKSNILCPMSFGESYGLSLSASINPQNGLDISRRLTAMVQALESYELQDIKDIHSFMRDYYTNPKAKNYLWIGKEASKTQEVFRNLTDTDLEPKHCIIFKFHLSSEPDTKIFFLQSMAKDSYTRIWIPPQLTELSFMKGICFYSNPAISIELGTSDNAPAFFVE